MKKTQRTILITGGAKRIGRALAEFFVKRDCFIIMHYYRSEKEAQEFADLYPQNSAIVCADLEDKQQVQELFPFVIEKWGTVNCLINNASAFEFDDMMTASPASWDLHMKTNLQAPFMLSQGFAQQPAAEGNIINILDQRVWALTDLFMSYTLSKSALWELTQMMALALAPKIRVNGVGPGHALANKRQTPHHFDHLRAQVPLRCGPSLAEICHTVQFILDSPSMTGQMIALDGGEHLGRRYIDHEEERNSHA